MTKKINPLLAGTFILICIAAGAGVIIGIRGLEYFTSPVDTRYIAFGLKDDLGGLAVGDPVRIGGYKVGQVDKIELVNPDDPRVEKSGGKPTTPILLVSISVPKKYVIKQGVIPAVQTSITGTSNINFDSLGTGDPLPVMQFMVGKPSAMSELLAMASDLKPRISSIMTQVDEKTIPAVTGVFADARTQTLPRANATFDEFKAAGTSAKTTLSKIEGHVDPAMDKYGKAADSARSMMDTIRDVFGDTKEDFRTVMANFAKTSADIREKLPGILDKFDAAMVKVNESLTSVQESLTELKTASVNVKDATGGAANIVASNANRIDAMLEAMKNTGRNLEKASSEIRHSPWRLLYQPKTNELSNLNLFDAAREFAAGAQNLNDAAMALKDAAKDPKADETRVKALMQDLDDRFKQFQDVEKKLWDGIKE